MANTIRLKKRAASGSAGAPTTLAPSEVAFNEADKKLYYGFGDDGDGTSSSVISIGGEGAFSTLTTNQTISGNKTFTGTVDLSGATLSGNTTFGNNLVVSGDLTVSGTTTTVNSTTVDVADKNITLGNVGTPTDATANGGGITLKGATDHTIVWTNSTDSWDFSEHINAASGKEFKINNTSVLSASTLGSGVTGSSLTSVGTLSSGTWSASTIAANKGGTGQTSYSNGQLLVGNSSGSLSKATITAGSNITVTNSSGGITIAAAAGQPTAGDGIDVSGSEVSVDLKANGGLVIESTEVAVDLSASSITGTLAVGDGGTGATSASAARTALGLVIGTNVQAYDAQLADVAGLAVTNGGFIVGDGSNFVLESGSTARTSLGLAIGSNVQAYDVDLDNLSGCQSGASAALAALTSTEVAILDGATLSTTELNYVDGVTSSIQTQLDAKQASDAQLTDIAGLAVTNGGFIVGDGSNFVLESGATARTSLGAQTLAADLTTLSSCQSGGASALAALTSTEIAILDGATVTTSELNILDGVTSTAAELNILDGVTSTTAELNILDGVTSTTAELNIVDGSTSATSTTLAAADRMVINDAGTMVQVALSDLVTFLENGTASSFELDGGTF